MSLQVSKWGDSLAVRIPPDVVEKLGLKEGDQVDIQVAEKPESESDRDRKRQEALEGIRRLQRPFPPGFKFNRAELYER